MTQGMHRGALAFVVAVSLVAAPTSSLFAKPTAAEDAAKAEARARIEKGKQLYAEGAFEAALVEFQRAYELAPSYKILYNVALIEQQLNDFVASLRAYERYLKDGGKDVTAARHAEVEKSIATLQQSIASVMVKVNVDGADVTVDDVSVGKSPLADAVLVNAGKRRIVATKDGRSATKVVSVAGTDKTTVTLEVPAEEAPPVVATPAPTITPSPAAPTPEPASPKRPIPWIGVAVTGAFAAGTILTGVLALHASSTLKSDRDTLGTSRGALDDDQSSVKRWSITSDVLLAATAVSAGVTLVVWLKSPGEAQPGSDASASTSARLTLTPRGVVLAGTF